MDWKATTIKILTTPWILADRFVYGVLGFLGIAGLFHFTTNLSLQFFGPIAIFSGMIAPSLPSIPMNVATGLLLGIASIVFLAKMDAAVHWAREKYL